jgi:phage host-nuclease inhibitor protein Gam
MAKAKQPVDTIVIYEYNQEDLSKAIAEIANWTRQITESEDLANKRILAIQESLAAEIEPMKKEIKKISLSIKKFTDANREKLFKDGDKTIKLRDWRHFLPLSKTKRRNKLIEEANRKYPRGKTTC